MSTPPRRQAAMQEHQPSTCRRWPPVASGNAQQKKDAARRHKLDYFNHHCELCSHGRRSRIGRPPPPHDLCGSPRFQIGSIAASIWRCSLLSLPPHNVPSHVLQATASNSCSAKHRGHWAKCNTRAAAAPKLRGRGGPRQRRFSTTTARHSGTVIVAAPARGHRNSFGAAQLRGCAVPKISGAPTCCREVATCGRLHTTFHLCNNKKRRINAMGEIAGHRQRLHILGSRCHLGRETLHRDLACTTMQFRQCRGLRLPSHGKAHAPARI